MFQGDSFQSDAFQVGLPTPNMGGDPAPLPMIGLILQYVAGTSIIQIIMNQLRQQNIA